MRYLVSRRAAVLGAALAVVDRRAWSQRQARIGWLSLASTGMYAEITGLGYVKGLREGGFEEGRNLVVVRRSAEGDAFKLRALARELVKADVDVIFAPAKILADAAWSATTSIPTVIATVTDPVVVDYAKSLARPGKHITGVTTANAELIGKRLQLLTELVPGLQRVAIPIDPDLLASCTEEVNLMEKAARTLGLVLVRVPIKSDAPDLEAAIRYALLAKAQAIVTAPMTSNYSKLDELASRAKAARLPFVHDFAQSRGEGLAVYGPDFEDIFRRAGHYTARILKGEKPADMPIEEPRSFRLIVNLSTARALGLTVPQALRLRADEVVE